MSDLSVSLDALARSRSQLSVSAYFDDDLYRRELELILQGIDLPAQRPRGRPRERVPDAKRVPDAEP